MTDQHPTVVVTSDDTLPDVVGRLREAAQGGRVVDLVTPIDSALLLTAREFRALKEAIDDERLAVVLRTADPLRLQLAERLGLPARALPRPRVSAIPVVAASAPPVALPDPATISDEDWPGETRIVEPGSRSAPESHWPGQNGSGGLTGDLADEEAEPEAELATGEGNPPRRWLPVAVALVMLVAATLLALRYVIPRATITIVPKSAPVASVLVFDVTADGQPLDGDAAFALTPSERQVEVVWEGSMPVTGVRVEPDGTASGAIELRNAAAEPLTVEAGTTIGTETGVEFAFAEAVAVPAADAATGEPGAATGSVEAILPGSGGNIGTGELGGRLPNGVYYSNRMGPAEGGTDKEFPVVDQADLDGLVAVAREEAPALVAAAVVDEGSGAAILPASVEITSQRDAFDRQAGEDAAEVSLRATMTVDVLTYDGAAAAERFQRQLAAQLQTEAPAGYGIGPEEIAYGEPVTLLERDAGVRLEVTANANATAILNETERAALAAALAGTSAEEAASVLARLEEIADFSIDNQPSWLGSQLPNNAGRIEFEMPE